MNTKAKLRALAVSTNTDIKKLKREINTEVQSRKTTFEKVLDERIKSNGLKN